MCDNGKETLLPDSSGTSTQNSPIGIAKRVLSQQIAENNIEEEISQNGISELLHKILDSLDF